LNIQKPQSRVEWRRTGALRGACPAAPLPSVRAIGPTAGVVGSHFRPGATIDDAGQLTALAVSVPLSCEPWRPLARGGRVAIARGRLVMSSHGIDETGNPD
jgi:hypothetical protein